MSGPTRGFALLVFGALSLAGLSATVRADGLYVICNSSVQLSADDLRDVFLGEKQFAGPVKLAPADNRGSQPAFLEKVLKMAAGKYLTAWTKKSFRDGVNPPPVKSSDAEALAYVRSESGACSYVTTAPGPGVVVVANL
jgi:hypothetical protein